MSPVRCSAVLFVVAVASHPAAAQTPDGKSLVAAQERYKAAIEKAEKAMLATFDADEEVVRRSSRGGEEKQRLLDQIKKEKADFKDHGWYPWSARARTDLIEFVRARTAAEKALAEAFDQVIDAHTRAKNDTAAAAVLKQKKEHLAPKVVARWELRGENWNGTWVAELYSNGRYTDPDGKATWTLERTTVVLTQPEAGAPKGMKVIRWNVSVEGTTLTEQSNLGGKSSGKLANIEKKD